MTCLRCKHHEAKRFGFYGRKRIQRYRCPGCNSTFSEPRRKPLGRHYTEPEKAAQIVTLLLEGMSVRVERANLSVRTHLRRFTRLSLGFSKSLDHIKAAVNFYMAFFNFVRVHQRLSVTPAMDGVRNYRPYLDRAGAIGGHRMKGWLPALARPPPRNCERIILLTVGWRPSGRLQASRPSSRHPGRPSEGKFSIGFLSDGRTVARRDARERKPNEERTCWLSGSLLPVHYT